MRSALIEGNCALIPKVTDGVDTCNTRPDTKEREQARRINTPLTDPSRSQRSGQTACAAMASIRAFLTGVLVGGLGGYYMIHRDVTKASQAVGKSVDVVAQRVRHYLHSFPTGKS